MINFHEFLLVKSWYILILSYKYRLVINAEFNSKRIHNWNDGYTIFLTTSLVYLCCFKDNDNGALQKSNLGALLVLRKDISDSLSPNTKIFSDVASFFSVTNDINSSCKIIKWRFQLNYGVLV